jgi:hypothetical protein
VKIPDLGVSKTILHESLLVDNSKEAVIYITTATQPKSMPTLLASRLSQYLLSRGLKADIERILQWDDERSLEDYLSKRLKLPQLPTAFTDLTENDSIPSQLFEDASSGTEEYVDALMSESDDEPFFEALEMESEMDSARDLAEVLVPVGDEFLAELEKTRYLELQDSYKSGFVGEFFVFPFFSRVDL